MKYIEYIEELGNFRIKLSKKNDDDYCHNVVQIAFSLGIYSVYIRESYYNGEITESQETELICLFDDLYRDVNCIAIGFDVNRNCK